MIYTVNGPIEKSQMGITLSHEHFKCEYDDRLAHALYYSHRYDLVDVKEVQETIVPILRRLVAAGVQTIVEASPPIDGQNLMLLKRLSEVTGLQIIPSTGQNALKEMADLAGPSFPHLLAKRWISDFEQGLDTVEGVIIRPGYIKLLMDRGSLSPRDLALLQGAVEASQKTGMGIQCHMLEANQVLTILDIVEAEGLDMSRFLWSHADKEGCLNTIEAAVKKGIWIGVDLVKEAHHEERLALIKALASRNLLHRVLLSSDYDFYEVSKNQGFANPCTKLLTDFIPLCITNGIEEDQAWAMVRENPANFFAINKKVKEGE